MQAMRLKATITGAVFFFTVGISRAGLIMTTPSGLAPGSRYRLAFVTSQTRNAASSNINAYNNFVSNVAAGNPELAALGTNWTAIARASRETTLQENTDTDPSPDGATGVPIYRMDGVRIARNYDDLWDGHIAATLSIDEFGRSVNPVDANGEPISGIDVWTGALVSGLLGADRPFFGDTFHTNGSWIQAGIDNENPSNTIERAFYGISGILTVPEPAVQMQQFVLDVLYEDGAVITGPLSFGLSELPENVRARFVLEGDSMASTFTLDNILSSSLAFGDGLFTDLETFSMQRDLLTGEIIDLNYQFAAIDTSTVEKGITLNFPLSISGTDMATGQPFQYSFTTSTQTLSTVPEPSSLALLLTGGLGLFLWRGGGRREKRLAA
jgi:hypothetical protein